MSKPKLNALKVVKWFQDHVRPVFVKTEPAEAVAALDKQAVQVEELEKKKLPKFPICLLGQAGVGKSTLINTLIADNDIVVPSGGGSGPLTASALRVSYGETRSFSVLYHSKDQLGRLRFVLETTFQRQMQNGGMTTDAQPVSDPDSPELDTEEQKRSRTDEAIGRARLLVAGAQTAQRDLPYLIDAIRVVLDQDRKFDTSFLQEDLPRLRQIKTIFKNAQNGMAKYIDSHEVEKEFRKRLREHACGFLAPMIHEMSIRWPAPLLRGAVELVDLPGIGILNDAYTAITSEYMRNRAKAVMLVTNDRGIRREDAEQLKASGFLNRLLHSGNDLSADPVSLFVVVVRIDDVAVENWKNDKAVNGVATKTKAEHFAEQSARCEADIAERLGKYLREVWEDDTEGKRDVIDSLVKNLQVFPVSAPQYRLHISSDAEDDKPFLPDAEATNIPRLRSAIADVARRCVEEQDRRSEEAGRLFFDQLRTQLEVQSAQRSQERQAEEKIEKFKKELNEFVSPLQREFDNRRGGFRTFLRKTVPAQIEGKVVNASGVARKGIQSDLGQLKNAHWKTLQAAVRNQGTFYGSRHINLPKDFALRFESPLAEVWSREILTSIRRETKDFAQYQSDVVTQVLDWSRQQGLNGSTRLLEALVDAVNVHRQKVNAVGKEAVDDLRDKVRAELIKKIEPHIRRKCQKFVADKLHEGVGVKQRMLDLFGELGEEVVAAATGPASNLLIERFKEVDTEILTAFREHSDPLNEAADSLVQRHEHRVDHSNLLLLKSIDAALANIPVDDGVGTR